MKKLLLGFLIISAGVFANEPNFSKFDELEASFQELEAKEKILYHKRRLMAEDAQKALNQQRELYNSIIMKENKLNSVKDKRFYQKQYGELANKYSNVKKELEKEMKYNEDIIAAYEAVKQISENE